MWRFVLSDSVKDFQNTIRLRDTPETLEPPSTLTPERPQNQIKRIIVLDGSTVTHAVRSGYPGAEAALLQLAAVVLDLDALRRIPPGSIPRPSTIRAIEECSTLDAVLPGRNVVRRDVADDTAEAFFRHSVYQLLGSGRVDRQHETLLETMRQITPEKGFGCPLTGCDRSIESLTGAGLCPCPEKEPIYETDVLRIHERFEDYGSSAQAYTATRQVVEHLAMINILRFFEQRGWWAAFESTAFVLDGPLAIFGMPARLRAHLEREVTRLHTATLREGGSGVLLFGVEKSGMHLDHLKALDRDDEEGPHSRVAAGSAFALDKAYVHRHIVLRPPDAKAHGDVTDYGRRILYKNKRGQHAVVMTPIVNEDSRDRSCTSLTAYPRLGEVLDIMDEFSTYLYEDGFAPLARAHAHAAIPLKVGVGMLTDLFSEA